MEHRARHLILAFLPALAAIAATLSAQEAADIAQLAETGNDGAQLMMALLYLRGNGGFTADIAKALTWLRRAAASGNSYAGALIQEWRARRRVRKLHAAG